MYSPRAVLRLRSRRHCPPDQSINAKDSWASQFLQPASDAPSVAVFGGWAAAMPYQSVPMIGEEVGYVEPCDDV